MPQFGNGLAGTVRPEQGDDRSGLHGEIDAVEDNRAAQGLADASGINCVANTLYVY
jgi:hypothetical protein